MTDLALPPTSRVQPRPRLAAFDGLRAVAALSVLGYHVCIATSLTRHGSLAPLLGELNAGVAVFFVISGCLLYLPYARALRGGGPLPDWRAYANRRALRILPGYWAALTILALGPLAGWVLSPNWWRFYGLAQIYSPDTLFGGLGVAWSLCVEVTFYALLPVLALFIACLSRRSSAGSAVTVQTVVLATLALISCAVRYVLAGSLTATIPQSGMVLATALPGFLDWFAFGMVLALLASVWESAPRRFAWARSLGERSTLSWAAATACFAAAALAKHGDVFLPLAGLDAHLASGLGAALIVLPAVAPEHARTPRGVIRLVRHPLALWLGAISYGIYLWHVPVLQAINGSLSPNPLQHFSPATVAGLLVEVVVGAVILGAASWYLVEQPAKRLFAPRRKPEPVIVNA
jgi:peptidoglycan/LPS O-acetylase OafA/YrhL